MERNRQNYAKIIKVVGHGVARCIIGAFKKYGSTSIVCVPCFVNSSKYIIIMHSNNKNGELGNHIDDLKRGLKEWLKLEKMENEDISWTKDIPFSMEMIEISGFFNEVLEVLGELTSGNMEIFFYPSDSK